MLINDFFNEYYLTESIDDIGNDRIITTKLVNRNDESVGFPIKARLNIDETNQSIEDSQKYISITPFDWETIIDETRRMHISLLCLKFDIEDFNPHNGSDISQFYL